MLFTAFCYYLQVSKSQYQLQLLSQRKTSYVTKSLRCNMVYCFLFILFINKLFIYRGFHSLNGGWFRLSDDWNLTEFQLKHLLEYQNLNFQASCLSPKPTYMTRFIFEIKVQSLPVWYHILGIMVPKFELLMEIIIS